VDEKVRRSITWVVIIGLIATIAVFAYGRKTELDRLTAQIGGGSPAEQLAATERLVAKQKMLEALEERPRWVQERAALAIGRLGTYDALWEAGGAMGVLDEPPQARVREAVRLQGVTAMDLLVEGIQDKDGNRRGCFAGPLGQIGEPAIDPLSDLMDAWDQYVRDICRDQLAAILAARDSARTAAKTLVETRETRLKAFTERAAKPPAGDTEDYAKLSKEERAKLAEAQEAQAKVPTTLIVDQLLIDILLLPAPPAERKQEAAEYLRRVATAKATVTSAKGPLIQSVIDQLLTAEAADVRATGCELLGAMGNQTYSVTGDVVGAPVGEPVAEPMVAPLLTRLQSDPEWPVRRKAAVALGRLQLVAMKQGATRPLIAALSSPRAEVKAAAAQALGMIAAARPFDTAALKWTETGPNEAAKAAAAPLAATLRQNRAGAASELATALQKVGPPAIPHLLPALDHPEVEVRLLATETVAEIGTPAAVAPLARKSLVDREVAVRQTAANALRELATPEVTPNLVQALGDEDWKVYYAAKDALARLGAAAVPALVQALSSNNARIAYTAEQSLAAIGAPAVEPLVQSLSSGNAQVLKWVSIALGDIGYDAWRPASRVLAQSPSPSTRAAAAKALGGTGYADAVKPLLDAANDPAPQVRIAVASGLVQLGDARATPTLVGLLQDKNGSVRAATMDRLLEWYDPPTLPELAKLLESGDADVRRRSAIVLAHHVGGQEELQAAVASATTAGEAHEVPQRLMNNIAEWTDKLVAGADAEAQSNLQRLADGQEAGPRYASVVGMSTVARRTQVDANRDWAVAELAKRLTAKEQELQTTAAVAVARARVPGVLEAAVKESGVAADVRRASVEALGLLGTDSSVPILIPLCEAGGPDASLAADAIGSIGRRISEESEGRSPEAMAAADTLIKLARAERDPLLKAQLGLSIAQIGEASVTPAINFLKDAEDAERPFAAAVLGKLGNVAVDPYLLRARNEVRAVAGQEAISEWFAVALWATGDKMARDYCQALPPEEQPSREKIDQTNAELEKLLDVM
jgi:HEAT repeat protein